MHDTVSGRAFDGLADTTAFEVLDDDVSSNASNAVSEVALQEQGSTFNIFANEHGALRRLFYHDTFMHFWRLSSQRTLEIETTAKKGEGC